MKCGLIRLRTCHSVRCVVHSKSASYYNLVALIPSLQLALKTVNPARSAYASFLFCRSFFHSYSDGHRPGDSEEEDVEEEEDTIKCKITIKVCL